MIQAYVLFALVVVHGLLFASCTYISELFLLTPLSSNAYSEICIGVAVYNQAKKLTQLPLVYPVLNPTYLYHEVWPGNTSSLGIWRASLVFTGSVTSLIMLAVFITTFPVIRRKHFNVFYFTHLLMILAVVVICLHASTMLYCTAPGLALWVVDWVMRLNQLSGKMDSKLVALGKGWFSLSAPLPRNRLKGCACHSPLAHFHIHHTKSSIREIHPFTTITHLAGQIVSSPDSNENIMIQFLFRKSKATPSLAPSITENNPETRLKRQWTNKLADLVEEATVEILPPSERIVDSDSEKQGISAEYQTTLRLEGPYFTPANPASYDTVICLVAGTGVSGALAIAAAFHQQPMLEGLNPDPENEGGRPTPLKRNITISNSLVPAGPVGIWKRCVVVWSVREADHIHLPFWHGKQVSSLLGQVDILI